jgi:hypothetical protein
MSTLSHGLTDSAMRDIKEIYRLWQPVYPFLADHFQDLYGRTDGTVVEMGPFCGTLFTLCQRGLGDTFKMALFPQGLEAFFQAESRRLDIAGNVEILGSDPSLAGIETDSTDLMVFRGALFFPSLFAVDFAAILRVLKPGGLAFIGGGFGRFTPESVIAPIAARSRELNLRLGKTEVKPVDLEGPIDRGAVPGEVILVREGGLWVTVRKRGK